MPGLGQRLRVHALGTAEQFHAARVLRLGPHRAVEPRHRLGVVVEDLRVRVHHGLQRGPVAPEVGDQHLDGAARRQLANPADALGEDPRAAVGLLVAVDAGQHGVLQPHGLHRLADPARLVGVQQAGPAGLDLAEAATAGAGVAHEQEGGRAAPPALADVGAHGLFAHGVQALAAEELGELAVLRAVGRPDAQPFGPPAAGQQAVAGGAGAGSRVMVPNSFWVVESESDIVCKISR